MQHLVGYVESSGDEAEQAQSTTAPFQGAQGAAPKANANNNIVDGIGESDDEEAEQRANDKKSITSPHKTRGLPSADELLSAANASSWLAKPKWAMKPSEPTYVLLMRHLQKWVHRRITRPQTFAKKELPTADARDAPEYGDDMYQVYDPAKGWLGKQPTNFVDSAAGYGGPGVLTRNTNDDTASAGAPTETAPNRKTNKRASSARSTAKERVKQQRMAGQSGLGDDFRVWRSEEEMRLRQQYD